MTIKETISFREKEYDKYLKDTKEDLNKAKARAYDLLVVYEFKKEDVSIKYPRIEKCQIEVEE